MDKEMYQDFVFEVKDALGNIVSPNAKLREHQHKEITMSAARQIAPGQQTRFFIELSEIYDLQAGQTYIVQAFRYIRTEEAGPWTKIASNTVQFTLTQ